MQLFNQPYWQIDWISYFYFIGTGTKYNINPDVRTFQHGPKCSASVVSNYEAYIIHTAPGFASVERVVLEYTDYLGFLSHIRLRQMSHHGPRCNGRCFDMSQEPRRRRVILVFEKSTKDDVNLRKSSLHALKISPVTRYKLSFIKQRIVSWGRKPVGKLAVVWRRRGPRRACAAGQV